jgi:bifunctional enzyme CysN/CysC
MIVWMSEEPMVPGKQYLFKQTTRMITGTVSTLRYQVDVNTLHRENAPTLGLNEIGRCDISLSEPVSFDSYRRNRATGSFIVIDRISNSTVAAGMILDRTAGTRQSELWNDLDEYQKELQDSISAVETNEREARFGQKPATLLLTGLTGAGKTSLAYALERRLFDMGRAAMVLDGQNLRRGISKDLGFTAEDRSENLRRSAEVAQLMNNAGLICIAALVAPSEEIRQRAAETIGNDRFLVIHVHAPLEVCRERDTSGIYEKVDRGEIRNFPGVSATYEEPVDPALRVETEQLDIGQCVDQIIELLESRDILSSS